MDGSEGGDVPPGEWEAVRIIGEVIDGTKHYATLQPEDNLGHGHMGESWLRSGSERFGRSTRSIQRVPE